MKKIILALIAFSVIFTACTINSSEENMKENIDLDLIAETSEENNNISTTNNLDEGIETVQLEESTDNSQFDILEHEEYDFSSLTYKSAETSKNKEIEAVVKETFFKDVENPKYSYTYNYTDLNSDEYEDVIVLLGGMEFAGSGGSTVLILKGEVEGLSFINKVTLARTPIIVTNTISNGYKDLMFVVYGGGSETSYNILKYDGLKYPSNPSVQLAADKHTKFTGEALISNLEYYKELISVSSLDS